MSTAASPADPGPFGGVILCDDTAPGPASHDGTGRRFVFRPPPGDGWRYAMDVEARGLPAPDHLTRALGPDAMRKWGEIEVIAKLADLPAHLVLRRVLAGDLQILPELQTLRADTPDLWCIIGRVPLV